MHHLSKDMQTCIEACSHCHMTCLSMASNHCLEAGGQHVAPEHFRLMMACSEICRTSATLMLIGMPQHKPVCAACATICDDCADSCEQVGGMEACVEACRRCAESCRRMAA